MLEATERNVEVLRELVTPYLKGKFPRGNDITHYEGLPYAVLSEMVEKGVADPDECQNASPSIGEFLDDLERFYDAEYGEYIHVTFHGYVVSPERNDFRISVEGFDISGLMEGELLDVVLQYRMADDLSLGDDSIRTWWD